MHTLAQLRSGELPGISRLKISENLTEFPLEILDLADTLEIMDLSGNCLKTLPPEIRRLKKLKIVFLSDNQFTEFPEVLGECPELEMIGFKANKITKIPAGTFPPNLRWLILTDNQISELPAAIGNCNRMQKLMLAGNKLKKLPEELALCQNLELLRISANELEEIPEWLLEMPKLSWLAMAGNPATEKKTEAASLTEISWNELQLENVLGEGASGIISKARWQNLKQTEKPVAVKVFKGEVTSDGLPANEMAAMIAAGNHKNIIPVLGKISGHPEQKQGLVLELISPDFKNLGNPPSFQTCTRDTFPNDTVFSLKSVLNISSGIAAAVAHLHQRGVLHGDLYAHNILINQQSEPLLSDFGAASLYNPAEKTISKKLEKLEVRAFGNLLDDLFTLLEPSEKNKPEALELNRLKTLCLLQNVEERPDFEAICQTLNLLFPANAIALEK